VSSARESRRAPRGAAGRSLPAARPAAARAEGRLTRRARSVQLARLVGGLLSDARFSSCTVHDKLSCTRLQNYTIGASLKSVSVSVGPMEFKLKSGGSKERCN